TLSNAGGTAMSWTISQTTNWFDLSATSGTLAAGDSTNIFVSLNANAYALTPGSYSGTIGFTNTTNGAGNTTRAVSLGIAQFGVTPTTGFVSTGPVGGGFSPSNTVYTLTNSSSSVSLTWGASASQTWLT